MEMQASNAGNSQSKIYASADPDKATQNLHIVSNRIIPKAAI
jgi:hypothetical protein